MGSSKRNGRNQGHDRRGGDKGQRRRGIPKLESLEGRVLLDGSPSLIPWKPTTTNLADVKNGPMANSGRDLIDLYQAFQQAGGNASSLAARFPLLQFNGDK